MSKPPDKAIKTIKNYCEKHQCRLCAYGYKTSDGYSHLVGCRLTDYSPCEWEVEEVKDDA